ncbi:MAG TPA: response regulator, partial [Phenylobacterium sp.]|nr:response regulator [Phenylobacterium sp.]
MSLAEAAGPLSRHLLVVDDDDRIRELLKAFLSREGFRVTTAANAGAARKLLESFDVDLAVFDVMMPGEDGVSLT